MSCSKKLGKNYVTAITYLDLINYLSILKNNFKVFFLENLSSTIIFLLLYLYEL